MNEILESLYARKSVRAYTGRPVTAETKELLFRAAFEAPTAGCQQLYTILDVTDQGKKESLAVLCDNQPFIAQAPVVLIFCADHKKWLDAYAEAGLAPHPPGLGDALLAMEDAVAAAQNVVTAGESLGLGSCYIGDILENCERVRELLALPGYVFPACMLVMGYATEQQKSRPKPERFEKRYVVCENGYHPLSGAELREMFRKRAGEQGYDRWMEKFFKRKYESDFCREMSRSAAVWLADFQPK